MDIRKYLTEYGITNSCELTQNSRHVRAGDIFIALKGEKLDGHDFVKSAENNGACAILCERDLTDCNVPFIVVPDLRKKLAKIATIYYDNPSNKLQIIGVTGTDGKTSTSTILHELISNYEVAGYIGTNRTLGVTDNFHYLSDRTTPDPITLNSTLNNMIKNGVKTVVMEVSSHAIAFGRIDGLVFSSGIFTNLSHEHLDFHSNMTEYLLTKAKLFQSLKNGEFAILNADDKNSAVIDELTSANVVYYGIDNEATYKAKNIKLKPDGASFDLYIANNFIDVVNLNLLGVFNIYNVLAVITYLHLHDYNINKIITALSNVKTISGRMEQIANSPRVIVDYAHTPNGIANSIQAVKSITTGKVTIVLGTASERDILKRPTMGKVASDLADHVIFTDEDPRFEDPKAIIDDLIKDIKKRTNYSIIHNRKDAIISAINNSNENDTVLITGKGHENFIEYGDVLVNHNDISVVRDVLNIK